MATAAPVQPDAPHQGVLARHPLTFYFIIAETRFAPIKTPTQLIPSFAGLGLAFYAATIRETIELFPL
jgi:hypothetical protein